MSGMFSNPRNLAEEFHANAKLLKARKIRGRVWITVLYTAVFLAILSLASLLLNIFDGAFGYIAYKYVNEPSVLDLDGKPYTEQDQASLLKTIKKQVDLNELDGSGLLGLNRLAVMVEGELGISLTDQEKEALSAASGEELLSLVMGHLSRLPVDDLRHLLNTEVVGLKIIASWGLFSSLLNKPTIEAEIPKLEAKILEEEGTETKVVLEFRSWFNPSFVSGNMQHEAADTGIRTALFGSLFVVLFAILIALPIGVAAAVYLEEFADKRNKLIQFIQLNIYNLAGVPSIIYGVLGLLVFVRLLGDVTQGRTLISGSLTLALLVLPVIIINSQEALRAVPKLLRDSAFGVGATRLQVVWHHVLPNCFDRILTGTIIAISRALGETAPLIVVGASTFIQVDPAGIFSGYTALPMQIYKYISYPQDEFKHVAAAAIVALLILLVAMNSSAILIRNRISKRRSLL